MKKQIVLAIAIILSSFGVNAQDDILKVFNDQVEAFNNADIDRLVDNVSEDFKFYYITSNELIVETEGKDQFRKSMENYFIRDSKVISKIVDYSVLGNRISFTEEAGHNNIQGKFVSSMALGVYQIDNGKITRAWYFID